ncbi:PHC3 isoform 11, partial [Pan troglodytes]
MAEAEFKDHSTAMDTEPNPGTSSVSTTTSSTTTTTITTSSSRMQQPQISVYSGSDRHAVQVIQQALHRPPSSAAQYLQQMYAAQQQHLMLHTAALQQQHLSSSQLQSLAAVQASLSSGRPSTSPTGSVTQQSTSYSPIQPHSLIKHQQIPLHSPPSKVSHHQLILQQQQQQIQPITLQNSTQDPPPSQHCIPLQNHGLPPAPSNAQSQHCSPIQ